jgi:diguanylate cyclase (GGDEF)-like protein
VGELNATAIIDSTGKYKGARIIIRDITGRIQAEEEIKKLIITDNLTGLYNQRHFYDQLAKEVERAKRTGRPLSLLLFDIDNFKSYNDSFGHLDGDRVLAKMGKIITCHIRNIDMGFRYGGEEFTVILPDSDINQAIRVAKRLREAFSGCLFMPESRSDDMMVVYKTISIGVAQYRLGDNFKSLVKNADDAMYIAKRAGGDRIHIFQAYHS